MKVCGKKDIHVPGCDDCQELEERVEAVEECCEDAQMKIEDKADTTYVDENVGTIEGQITEMSDALNERIDNIITSSEPSITTLWEGDLALKGHSVQLSDNVNNYDFLDVYYKTSYYSDRGYYGYIRVPADEYENYTTTIGGIDRPSTGAGIRQYLTMLSFVDDTATIQDIRRWYWDGNAASDAEDSSHLTGIGIYRIDGVKISGVDSEVADARVGVDGTIYPSLGDAIRGQIQDTRDMIPQLVKTVQGNPIVIDDAFGPVKNLTVELLPIQAGTGTPSPQNIRPITGHDSVTVGVTGKNLWGGLTMAQSFSGKTNVYTLDQNNKFFTYSRSTGLQPEEIFKMAFQADKNYSLLFTYTATGDNASLRVVYTDGTYSTLNIPASSTKNTIVKTLSTASKTIKNITLAWNTTGVVTVYYEESGLFEGVITAADFAPYKSQSKTVTLPHTVYGAGVGFTSGEGKEKTGIITFDGTQTDLAVTVLSDYTQVAWTGYQSVGLANGRFWASTLEYVSINQGGLGKIHGSTAPRMFMGLPVTVTTRAEAQAWFANNPTTVVYELATPTDLQTTPTDITLYNGDNVISSDGDIDLTYVQDMATVIRKIENQL